MLILVIGDLHIPQRKLSIPDQFLKLIVPGKIDKIISVGNLTTPEQLVWLKTISKEITSVLGDFDENITDVSDTTTITIGSFKIGLIHGHQVIPWGDPERLASVARDLDVDVLISGQTHQSSVATFENRLFLNPGSLTGAYSNLSAASIPSFMILDIKKDSMIVYNYQIIDGAVKISNYDHKNI